MIDQDIALADKALDRLDKIMLQVTKPDGTLLNKVAVQTAILYYMLEHQEDCKQTYLKGETE